MKVLDENARRLANWFPGVPWGVDAGFYDFDQKRLIFVKNHRLEFRNVRRTLYIVHRKIHNIVRDYTMVI